MSAIKMYYVPIGSHADLKKLERKHDDQYQALEREDRLINHWNYHRGFRDGVRAALKQMRAVERLRDEKKKSQ